MMNSQYKPIMINLDNGQWGYFETNPYDYITTCTYEQSVPYNTWTITHNMNSTSFIVKVFDINGNEIVPDQVYILDLNNIIVTLSQNMTGSVTLYFFG